MKGKPLCVIAAIVVPSTLGLCLLALFCALDWLVVWFSSWVPPQPWYLCGGLLLLLGLALLGLAGTILYRLLSRDQQKDDRSIGG